MLLMHLNGSGWWSLPRKVEYMNIRNLIIVGHKATPVRGAFRPSNVSRNSDVASAIAYALGRWVALMRSCDDGSAFGGAVCPGLVHGVMKWAADRCGLTGQNTADQRMELLRAVRRYCVLIGQAAESSRMPSRASLYNTLYSGTALPL